MKKGSAPLKKILGVLSMEMIHMGTFQYCTIRFHIEGLNPNVTDGRTDGRTSSSLHNGNVTNFCVTTITKQ